jgi:arylsulfatase A-like enzyme
VGHIDVVPTLLAAAGLDAPVPVDGEALQEFAADADHRIDRAILVESGPGGGRTEHFDGVRTASWAYTEHGRRGDAGIDLYDLGADPFQLESVHADQGSADVREAYAAALGQLVECVGRGCVVSVAADP